MTSPDVTIGDWLRIHARERGDREFLVDPGNDVRLSYAQVYERVCRLASFLQQQGIAKGDRVGVISVDNHQLAEVILATMSLGATVLPLNTRLVRREVDLFLDRGRARLLFGDRRSLDRLPGIAQTCPTVEAVIALEDGTEGADLDYESVLAAASPDIRWPEVVDDDIIRLSFTSGTTGAPKGVLQSHRMLKRLANSVLVDRELTSRTFHYNGSPLYHVSGFSHLLSALAAGYRMLLLPSFDAPALLHWLSDGGLTHCFLVPTMISSLLQQPGVEERDYSQLVAMGYGAAPMPPALLRQAMRVFGCDFLQIFGSSEAGSQTILGYDEHRRALAGEEHLLGSIGKPAYSTEVRICDDDLRELGVGEVGEIMSRGDILMSGYLDMPEESAAAVVDGWVRSGDLGYRDAEGFYYLSGRKKDLMIRGGENIYPIEIESLLFEFPGVREATVVGRPDEHWGEVVIAFLAVEWNGEDRQPDLVAFLRQQLAPQKVPAEFILLPELPKTSNGKVDKVALRATFTASPTDQGAPS